ncbi:MAG: hypothetical protein KGM99_04860 [Burkholderiales bacterium]|nr:hypothetical protein [Burkholderiales bacterium]
MKSTTTNALIFSTALILGSLAVSSAVQHPAMQNDANIQTVTIVAKRMTSEEKQAYDQSRLPVQTVVISAKRLTAEQKLAMDQEEKMDQQKLAQEAVQTQKTQG